MRALICGPPGTPYHDATFVFDLQLTPEFPQQPPLVHYLSHGERINPNLYENGRVCLSLLGTWTGRQSCELWSPETSSVLQVLVSIQGLVLCEMPYFNEAGYEKQLGSDEGEHHARRYNEGALLLSLKAMQACMHRPAPPFEELTRLHYCSVRPRVLQRCRTLIPLKDAPRPAAAAAAGGGGASEAFAAASAGAAPAAAPAAAPVAAPVAAPDAAAPDAAAPASASADAAAGAPAAKGPVAQAELEGVLNEVPSLGFLHSLARALPGLEKCFEEHLAEKGEEPGEKS